jgi:hypothetical protein
MERIGVGQDIALGLHRLYTPTPNTISQTSKEVNNTPVKFRNAFVEVGCSGSPLIGCTYATPPSSTIREQYRHTVGQKA